MGRKPGKVKVEFVDNQKARNQIFKRRNECVIKKIKELTTLCDVNACMFLCPQDQDSPTAPFSVWPPNDAALVDRLVQEFKGDDDDDDEKEAPIGVYLQKKSQFVRAQIDRLKSRADQRSTVTTIDLDGKEEEKALISKKQSELKGDDADQRSTITTIDLDGDGDDEKTQLGVFLQKKALIVRAQIDLLKSQRQRQIDYEDSSTGMMMPPRSVDDQFGSFTALMMDDDDGDDDDGSSSSYYPQQQQQYVFVGSSSSIHQEDEDYSSTAMMNTDQMMDSYCGIGFDEQPSTETAAVTDDFFIDDDGGLITQLYTPPRPPMMMWQSTCDDLSTQFHDKGPDDYSQYIDLDDLWA